jgi:hypothetical protein
MQQQRSCYNEPQSELAHVWVALVVNVNEPKIKKHSHLGPVPTRWGINIFLIRFRYCPSFSEGDAFALKSHQMQRRVATDG